jgi:hypothetical protein
MRRWRAARALEHELVARRPSHPRRMSCSAARAGAGSGTHRLNRRAPRGTPAAVNAAAATLRVA